MKKILSFAAIAFCFCALTTTFTSCGDDKADNPNPENNQNGNNDSQPASPTSIMGTWVGDFAAQPDNPNQLMWRYAHKLTYNFNSDFTFMITESACMWADPTDADAAQYDRPSLPIDPTRPAGVYLLERIVHRVVGTYTLIGNNKIAINVTRESWTGDESYDFHESSFSETFEYTITDNKLKIGDGSEYAVSPHNLIVYGEMIWQGAGDTPIPSSPAPAPSTDDVTKADLIGSWKVYLNGAPVNFTFTDTKLQIGGVDVDNDGAYTIENSRIAYRLDGEDVSFNVEMIHNKTVMLAITIIPANQSYSGEEERQTSFGYREGATIPVTASDIQGKWYWKSAHGFVGARAVLILDGNNFDLTITPWAERHTGTFTYENGYIHLTPEHSYTCRTDEGDMIDEEHPENSQWRVPGSLGPDDYYSTVYFGNPGDDVIPFIPNGTEAYGELANLQVTYYKQ